MRVLAIGATGFIGLPAVSRLVELGHDESFVPDVVLDVILYTEQQARQSMVFAGPPLTVRIPYRGRRMLRAAARTRERLASSHS
jgi:hypothetical protein